jgi:putative SOS response-associated peptidase YedK
MPRAFEVARDSAGNVPPLSAIFPDQMAPVVRTVDGERELIRMRWGFPPPTKVGTQPVTNVRNVASPFWRAWLKPQYRCLVPLTSFSEYKDTKPRKTPVWFARSQERPLAAFAGIWRPWMGVRGTKAEPVEGEHLLYSFLTSEPNGVVNHGHLTGSCGDAGCRLPFRHGGETMQMGGKSRAAGAGWNEEIADGGKH